MMMEQVLEKIRKEHGEASLRDGPSLLGLFRDYSHDQLRPQANALRTFLDCRGNERILNLQNASGLAQQTEYHRLIQEMVNGYGMQKEVALKVSGAFWRVALCTEPPVSAGESAPVKAPVIQTPLEKTDNSGMTTEEMYERGRQCDNAKGEPLQRWHNAVQWFEKAAERNHLGAQVRLGQLYSCSSNFGFPENPVKSAYWYRKAAEQGDGFSQRKLGSCYERGYGVAQDYSQAVHWYRKATENGDQYAQRELARVYRYWLNDPSQAVYWYRKAAEQGDTQDQVDLGHCYEEGYGVAKDCSQAVYWYRKAAEDGYRPAQLDLSRCYREGIGTAKDPVQADYWQHKAHPPKAEQSSANTNAVGRRRD